MSMHSKETFLQTQRRMGGQFWYLIVVWRMLWVIPAHIARFLLSVVMFCGWGWSAAREAWERTT